MFDVFGDRQIMDVDARKPIGGGERHADQARFALKRFLRRTNFFEKAFLIEMLQYQKPFRRVSQKAALPATSSCPLLLQNLGL